ncbi:MAG: 2-dehydropantoate 2-reductase [Thermoplasmata archaeon]
MRIIVLGAGAIGSLLGGRLQAAGHEVLFVARGPQLEHLSSDGLTIIGSFQAQLRVEAVDRIPPDRSADLVLVTVKTFDLGEAAREIAGRLAGATPVLLLENGLSIEAGVIDALRTAGWPDAADQVIRGINSIPATLLSPGTVRQAGEGEILLGEGPRERTDRIRAALTSAGVQVRVVPDLHTEIWRKALINAAINPVTADHRVANGELAREPWRGQAIALLHEARAVAEAEGFPFSEEGAEADLFRIVRGTAENRSSMLQDVERGHPTEIEAISGTILLLGQRHGIALPATERAVERIRGASRNAGAGRVRSSAGPSADAA